MKSEATTGWFRRRAAVVVSLAAVIGVAVAWGVYANRPPGRVAILNALRDEINVNYGFKESTPRINCGPCVRFVLAFREQWNARFRDQVNVACVMSVEGECGHVVAKFPDGSYFDGGNGVSSEQNLLAMYRNCSIEEMVEFDRALIDQRVGGLEHDHYPHCPNYSEELTRAIIARHLAELPSDGGAAAGK